jgi:glyoxylase-like metal-dependent hydrolase (beta-lactamase superfamily II)
MGERGGTMLEKITDRIYYMKHAQETDRPALGLVIGDECCLVVDAGASPKHAREFQEEIAVLKVPPVKYLVITHFHWDHVLGLSSWDAVTVAHLATENLITGYRQMGYDDEALEKAKEKGIYYDFAVSCIKKEIEDRENFKVGKIGMFYQDRMKIDLGKVTCELFHTESPHTEDTTIIYVSGEKVMFIGDCIYGHWVDGYNFYDAGKLFSMIDAIEQREADYYLCSHEPLIPRNELADLWAKLQAGHEFAAKCSNYAEALAAYQSKYPETPEKEAEFYIKSFGLRV